MMTSFQNPVDDHVKQGLSSVVMSSKLLITYPCITRITCTLQNVEWTRLKLPPFFLKSVYSLKIKSKKFI